MDTYTYFFFFLLIEAFILLLCQLLSSLTRRRALASVREHCRLYHAGARPDSRGMGLLFRSSDAIKLG